MYKDSCMEPCWHQLLCTENIFSTQKLLMTWGMANYQTLIGHLSYYSSLEELLRKSSILAKDFSTLDMDFTTNISTTFAKDFIMCHSLSKSPILTTQLSSRASCHI